MLIPRSTNEQLGASPENPVYDDDDECFNEEDEKREKKNI